MKVIDKIEIEYVLPESETERLDVENSIRAFEEQQHEKIDLSGFVKKNAIPQNHSGYWRMKKGVKN
ncbi:MAG: hypothetical protein U1F27_03735 [Turneriella sp.]